MCASMCVCEREGAHRLMGSETLAEFRETLVVQVIAALPASGLRVWGLE